MTNIAEQTLASIVTAHHQTVPVLEKYNLDFCCKGKRTLTQACTEKGLSVEEVLKELESTTESNATVQFAELNAEQLIQHILLRHHFYVKQSMPTIQEHLTKVANKHGDRFPYMNEVLNIFIQLRNELSLHLQKEETILFPRIKEVAALSHFNQKKNIGSNYIFGPVSVMESEHDEAGEAMSKIRELTNNYTAPEEACTTFKVSLAELKEFEEDLHKHVHLENNLLFPMAEKMLAAVASSL
ncbi:MAG: iron-sulfur cluster repair di-iron protein [Chitinophagaceae bacterium]|nr:iron-sulfur cluster repair di-iron protein [Chitinophagaceae bacterium]